MSAVDDKMVSHRKKEDNMGSPAPKVTPEDVKRKLDSDFVGSANGKAAKILYRYGKKNWHYEVERVQMEILKLAEGDIKKLKHFFKVADKDFRDVLQFSDD
jgi:hypothetical protein